MQRKLSANAANRKFPIGKIDMKAPWRRSTAREVQPPLPPPTTALEAAAATSMDVTMNMVAEKEAVERMEVDTVSAVESEKNIVFPTPLRRSPRLRGRLTNDPAHPPAAADANAFVFRKPLRCSPRLLGRRTNEPAHPSPP
jgi:hypothetical protein